MSLQWAQKGGTKESWNREREGGTPKGTWAGSLIWAKNKQAAPRDEEQIFLWA